MYNDTITLFNRYIDSNGDTKWFPHVLKGVNLVVDKSVIVAKYGERSNDNAVLNVKYHNVNGGKMVDRKPYLLPKEWKKQTDDLLPKSVTFTSGNDFDFFMEGDYGNEEIIHDEKGTFYSEMQKEYDNVFAVTSISCYSVIPHFEVLGK